MMIQRWIHAQLSIWLTALALCGIAGMLWLPGRPWTDRLATSFTTVTTIGQLLGLFGAILIALSVLLATRLPILDRLFGGLDRVYKLHHRLGAIGFVLLLAHPLAVSAKYFAISWNAAAGFLTPSTDWPVLFGMIALLSMEGTIVLTMFLKLPYRLWKWTHQVFGVSLILAFVHVLLISSDVATVTSLRWYMLSIMGLGSAAYIYRTVLGRWLIPTTEYQVTNVTPLNSQITEITLEPLQSPLSYTAGQYVFVSFHDATVGYAAHPFSLTSASGEKLITLGIKKFGAYTTRLPLLKPGTRATIEGPFGWFGRTTVQPLPSIWIAGGIGITPFISMLRSRTPASLPVTLFYCVRNNDDLVYADELNNRAQADPSFTWIPVVQSNGHMISADMVVATAPDTNDRRIFFCGPPKMMNNLYRQFRTLGVPDVQLISESFDLT